MRDMIQVSSTACSTRQSLSCSLFWLICWLNHSALLLSVQVSCRVEDIFGKQNTILETVLSAANAAQIYCPSARCDDRPVRETWAGFLSQANRAQGLTSGKCIAG